MSWWYALCGVCHELHVMKRMRSSSSSVLTVCDMHRKQYHMLKHHADLSILNGNNKCNKIWINWRSYRLLFKSTSHTIAHTGEQTPRKSLPFREICCINECWMFEWNNFWIDRQKESYEKCIAVNPWKLNKTCPSTNTSQGWVRSPNLCM